MNARSRCLLLLTLTFLVRLHAAEFQVTTPAEIAAAAGLAQPGDTLVMQDGVWTNADILFTAQGTASRPITLRAATLGAVHLTGTSRLRLAGNHLVVDGLVFTNGYRTSGDVIAFRESTANVANHSRLTNCVVVNYNPPNPTNDVKWVSLYGVSNRVENCYFAGKENVGATLVVWVSANSNAPNDHVISRNHFGPRPPLTAASNGGETIRLGTSDESLNTSRSIVEHNLFERCNGDAEIVSSKSCDNIIRRNTFVECEGSLVLRHGNRALVEGNFFLGNRRPLTGGVRVVGEDHVVMNNYFHALVGSSTRAPLAIMQGIPDSPLNGYAQVKRATIAFNTFVHCSNTVVLGLSGTLSGSGLTTTLPPLDCVLANNIVWQTGGRIVDQRITPENLVWEANILFGTTLGIATNLGTLRVDPQLTTNAVDLLWRPSPTSPALASAGGSFPSVTSDIDGDPRSTSKDIGADQASVVPPRYSPLASNLVGPLWQRATGTVLTWANPADLIYGTPLGAAQLNAQANAAGSLVYNPPAGTVLDVGSNQLLTVVFTPLDTNTFTSATQTVTINVSRGTPSIVWSNPAPIIYGTALGAAQLNPFVNVSGTLEFDPPAGTVLSTGSNQPLTLRFTPDDTNSYIAATATVFIDVRRAAPVLQWSALDPIEQGTPLGAAQLNATANVPGSFHYTPTSNTVLEAFSAHVLTVEFVPDDSINFTTVRLTNQLNVRLGGKTVPMLTWNEPAPMLIGGPLGHLQLNATANVPGQFVYSPPAGTVLPVDNDQPLTVTFTPDDSATYATLTRQVQVDVGGLSSNAIVRVVYVVPSNRTAQSNAVDSLQRLVLRYQQWFADNMEVNGFGRKTFTFETAPDGITPYIHVLSLPEPDAFLRADIYGGRLVEAVRAAGLPVGDPGQLWWLVSETHLQNPDGSVSGSVGAGRAIPASPINSGVAIMSGDRLALWPEVFHTNTLTYHGRTLGEVGPFPLVQDVSFPWFEGESFSSISSSAMGLGLRTFGEALGLETDFRNDENFNGNVMGFGFRGIRGVWYPKQFPFNACGLSYASALALDVNPFFNVGRVATDSVEPAVAIHTSGERSPFSGLLEIAFSTTDNQGLHAALLTWETDQGFVMAEERILNGTAFSGSFNIPYFTAQQTNRYRLIVYDRQGNRSIAESEIFPFASPNRSPQPFISVLPAVSGLGQDVVFSAEGTFDPEHSINLLEIEWDLDGDGLYEVPPSTALVITNNYTTLGSRIVHARITDPAGAVAVSAPMAVNVTVCLTTLSPLTRFHGFAGSTGLIEVTVGPKCQWNVVNTNDWIEIRTGASGSGPGWVLYNVLPNPSFEGRQGYLQIGDEFFLVRQHPLDCNYSLSPTNRFHGYGYGTNSFKVTAKADCAWTVVNTNSWIAITAGGSGVATGFVNYALSENRVTGKRTGHLTVMGEVYTITQWGTNCEVALNTSERIHGEGSEFGSVTVNTAAGCAWEAVNTNDWILITTATRGTNSGSFTYLTADNTNGMPRSAQLWINDVPFTVTQRGCSFALSLTNRIHTSAAQTGLVSVVTGGICPWTVENTNDWVTITAPSGSVTGSGPVHYSVQANPTSHDRVARILIAGIEFTILQAGKPCLYALVTDEAAFSHSGGIGQVQVIAELSCFWTVEDVPPWITILGSPTGEASGSVSFLVSTNDGPARTTTFTVASKEFSVSQSSGLREVVADDLSLSSGRTNCTIVTLGSLGGENEVAFSLCYDTNLLAFVSATLQSNATANATLSISNQAALGRVGLTIKLPNGQGMTPGLEPQLRACFRALNVTGRPVTTLSFCDAPVARVLKDTSGSIVAGNFSDADVSIFGLCSLAESLDVTNLNLVSGSIPWVCQTNDTHDGIDAGMSGVTPHSGESFFETVVTGPGTLSFWWKISSEPDSDRLRFYMDDTELVRISGEVDWQWRTFNISAGTHELRWRYSKNGDTVAGLDRAWVDEILFVPAPPSITSQPQGFAADEGGTASFSVVAAGQGPISYQWLWNGIALTNYANTRGAQSASLVLSNVEPWQAGNYSVVVANSGGSVMSVGAGLSVTPAVPLAEALDAPSLAWGTRGARLWIGQSIVTLDGFDAARSGVIGHSESTSLETTLNGPGVLTFWWKVSCETNNDRVALFLNGSEVTRISGEVEWHQRTINIGAGPQSVRWTYTKSSSVTAGSDRAWVDRVEYSPAPVVITAQPVSQTVDSGATAFFSVSASGATPFTYQWRRNGLNLVDTATVRGTTTATLTLSNVLPELAGEYSVLVGNAAGQALSSVATLAVNNLVPLAEAVDATNVTWTTVGTPTWIGQTAVTADGTDAARSGRIGDSQTTAFRTTFVGPGTVSFFWKVSSEPNDTLRLYVAGSEVARISGEVDWTWRTASIGSGNVVVEWRYTKSSSFAAGQDRGWVDQIVFVPSGVPTAPMLTIQPTNRAVLAGATTVFAANAVGTTPVSWQWFFNGTALTNGNGITGATTPSLSVANANSNHVGEYFAVVTNIAGSATSVVANLSVITAPVLVLEPADQTVAQGTTVNFAVRAFGAPALSYRWLRDGTNLINGGTISGVTSTNLRLTSVTAEQASTYFVVVSNSFGVVTSRVASLVVSTPPTIISQPASQTGIAGQDALFTVVASGSEPLTYRWRLNGINLTDGGGINGAASPTLVRANLQPAAAGAYSVVIANPVGSITSLVANLSVLSPPRFVVQPASQTVPETTSVVLNAGVTGTFPISYQWQRDGTNVLNGNGINGATTSALSFSNSQPEHSGVYMLVASNVAGVAVSSNVTLVVVPPLTLGEAVNAPYLDWTTNGAWFVQTNVTHDGEAAAQSGAIAHSNQTSIATVVTGPGTIRFWWKVSSQTNADTLTFYVGSTVWAQISGEADWQKLSFDLPPGEIPLRWTYEKNSNVVSGLDRAWLDEVDFIPSTAPSVPVILTQPVGQDVSPGSTVTLAVEALGTAPLSYQWRLDGQPLTDGITVLGANSPTLRLFNVNVAQSGLYDVVVRNNYSVALSERALINVLTTVPLNVALDTDHTNMFWRTAGFSPWRGQTAESKDQLDSAQSSPVAHGTSNWIQTTIDGGPLAVAFWWKVSSQTNSDRLRFFIDGVERANISGEVDWHQRSFPISNASAVVRWEYRKDASGSAGLDRAWVDRIELLHISPLITNNAPDTNIVDQGTTVRFKVDVAGTEPLVYQWRHNGSNLTESVKVIGATTSKRLVLSNAQPNQTGFYACQVGNDAGIDISPSMYLRVNPAAPIGPAVNATNLIWETGGYSWFVGTTDDSNTDNQSVRNGFVDHGHSTWMRTTVVGPGTIRYWWRSSTQANADWLRFLINGVVSAQISGSVSWQQRVINVPDGLATLQWEYVKDGLLTNGSDRVWIDDISFTPAPPSFVVQPLSQDADQGSTVTLTPTVTGGIGMVYRWRFNGVPLVDGPNISGTTSSVLRITGITTARAGNYSLLVTNRGGSALSSNAVLTVTPVLSLEQGLDTTNYLWSTGSPAWIGQPVVRHDGVDAARSPALADGQSSSAQTTVNGPGVVSFWWKVSSETNGDALAFFINNVEQARISGEVDWQLRSFVIDGGEQNIRFTYIKNASGKAGADRGWVDQFTFQPLLPEITSHPVGQTTEAGARIVLSASAIGAGPLTYEWLRNEAPVLSGAGVSGINTPTLVISNAQASASGTYALRVSNPSGQAMSSNAVISVMPMVSLATALDGSGLVWTTNTAGPWVGQTVLSHDGVDAARSGTIGHNASNYIQTIVTGPGAIGFWWRVSSEPVNDKLIFSINGVEQARISGEPGWLPMVFQLDSGSHTCRWTYMKNASLIAGADRAWVDQVFFGPQPPSIVTQPTNQFAEIGSSVTFRVTVAGSAPFGYQWQLNGVNLVNGSGISGATSSNLTLSSIQLSNAGNYRVVVTNLAGSETSAIATLNVFSNLTLAAALDTVGLPWTTNGSTTWTGHGAVTHDGTDAARSPVLGNSASAWMQTTVNGPGTVKFWWKVSSEPNDRLRFLINGVEQQGLSGERDWQERAFYVGASNQVLRWEYVKNSGTAGGLDRAWVDEVSFGTEPPFITSQPTNLTINAGATATFRVAVAAAPPISYRWHFNGIALADGAGIGGSQTATLTVTNAQLPQVGSYYVVVSNAHGVATSSSASLRLIRQITIAEALDNTTLNFTLGGTTTPWSGQETSSSDGEDAAQTGAMTDSTYTWIKATVVGPGTLSFWWKTSTEQDHDFLRFMLDAVDQVRISGETDWQQVVFDVPSGTRELQWRYSRSPSNVGGQDRAWLDRVTYTTNGGTVVVSPPLIQIQPSSVTVDEGETAEFAVSAVGAPPLRYRWLFAGTNWLSDGGNLGGTTTPELTLFNVLEQQAGDYSVVVSNVAGSVTSIVARLSVNPIFRLAEAIDQPLWVVTSDGAVPWEGHTVVSHDGMHAARSGVIGNGQLSAMQTLVDGPGQLHFWWRVSSETNADVLTFTVNGQTEGFISGESGWQEISVDLGTGPQFLDWTYFKNGSFSEGEDRAWVDQVTFVPLGGLAAAPKVSARRAITPYIATVKGRAELTWIADARRTYEVYYKDDLSDTDWQRLDGEVLARWLVDGERVRSDFYHATVHDALGGRARFYRIVEY